MWVPTKLIVTSLGNKKMIEGSDGERNTNVLKTQRTQTDLMIWQKHTHWT